MRHVPTSVAIVTTTVGADTGRLDGRVVRLGVARPGAGDLLRRPAVDHLAPMRDSDTFAINILGHGMGERCRSFSGKGADRFAGIDWNRLRGR